MNEAAKKLVARAARVAAKGVQGANEDDVLADEWSLVASQFPWSGARAYFEDVFCEEVSRRRAEAARRRRY